jgi:hypothetical protein
MVDNVTNDPSEETSWTELLRRIGERWPRLTRNDLASLREEDFSRCNYEGLVGRLRERYAVDESDAQRAVQTLLSSLARKPGPTRAGA